MEADYTPWLGQGYETNINEDFRCPTYVSNHTGWNDITVLLTALHGDISFLGGDFIKAIPVLQDLMIL